MTKNLIFTLLIAFSLTATSQGIDFNFQSTNGLYCNPTTIQFNQISSGNPTGFAWTFGNGQRSNDPNPVITYSSAGSFTVKLTVIYRQYAVEVSKTIYINPAIAVSINSDKSNICKPGTINFNATGNGNIATYVWDFGDGSGPVTTAVNNIAHNYLSFGVFNVTLKATDVSGCSGTTNSLIFVKLPSISGTVSPTSGCIPANVSFNANVTVPVNSSITNYTWNFKDGSPIVSTTTNNINHIYNVAGGYSPLLTITTSEGCTNSYQFDTLAFGTPPFNTIAYPVKTTICGSESASFFSKATNANSYYWDFGDGRNATVTDTTIKHKFFTLGIKNITVTPSYNGCKGTPVTFQINVVGVIAAFDYSNTCNDKKTFSFINATQGNISTLSWNFGDGSPSVTTLNPTHTFPASGSFNTEIFVTDNITGCTDKYAEIIYTANPILIDPDTAICKNSNTSFSISNNYNNPAATYTWKVLGTQVGAFGAPTLTIRGTVFGYYDNFVFINNGFQYCPDTIPLSHRILVRGPIADFTAPDTVCANGGYTTNNLSKPYMPRDTIKRWFWYFGSPTLNDTNFTPKPFVFGYPGNYDVKLVIIDKFGCMDSISKLVNVKPIPFLRAIPDIDTLCSGQSDTLIVFHNDPIIWSPANLVSCINCDTIVANPTVTSKIFVTATNLLGCSSTDSIFVKVYEPFVAKPLIDPYICLNDSVKLEIDPPNEKIIWSPSTRLSDANNYNPIASPLQTTTYKATLTDSAGCFSSSADIIVHVKSLPTVNAGPDKILAYNTIFSFNPLYSNNTASYCWTPSTLLSCSTCANPEGTAIKTTNYYLKVISDSGCIAKDTITVYVDCRNANILMPNAFTPNGDNLNDYYYPLTRGIKYIMRFSIYNREGKLVYEAKNFPPNNRAFGWDGKLINMEQTTAVFVYYIEGVCDVGERVSIKGSFVLIR